MVQVTRPQIERAASTAGCLGVQPNDESVEFRIVTGSGGGLSEFVKQVRWERGSDAARAPRLGNLLGRIVRCLEVTFGDRELVQAAGCGDEVFNRAVAVATVAAQQSARA